MMAPGIVLQNFAVKGEWETVGSGLFGGSGAEYHTQNILDLRALLAGNESGIAMTAMNLQEGGPWSCSTENYRGWFMTVDFVTTVKPDDEFLAEMFQQPSIPGAWPGMLRGLGVAWDEEGPSKQDFNPSQVLWGLWRFWGTDTQNALGSVPTVRVLQSGNFGEGETVVSPALWWTRLVITDAIDTAIIAPSANLVCRGAAVDLTTAQEVTQMMRAAQR